MRASRLPARTNRVTGGRAPSKYLLRLANSAGVDAAAIDCCVGSPLARPGLMRKDDFDAFFAHRQSALLDKVATAMGKEIDGTHRVRRLAGHLGRRRRHGRSLTRRPRSRSGTGRRVSGGGGAVSVLEW